MPRGTIKTRTPNSLAGGSGAGVSINPVAFLIVGRNNTIKLIPASFNNPIDRVLDAIPNVIEQIKKSVTGKDQGKSCKKKDNGKEDDTKEEGKDEKQES